MRAKKDAGEKPFTLMLGAGASMGSGVPSTPKIMRELLERFGNAITGNTEEERFDLLWRQSADAARRLYLKPYLDLAPSPGYLKLAQLIDAGYFDVVVTFNFDRLLETALDGVDGLGYKTLIRGETVDDEMLHLVELREPRVKVAKLHGSLQSADHFLFAAEEMNRYPEPIEAMLRKVTAADIIICGYAFNDLCVVRAFSEQGGSVVCVDPSGVPKNLRVFTKNRRSEGLAITEYFDRFMEALHGQLLGEPEPIAPVAVLPNPFRFLESYERGDTDTLLGRERETKSFLREMREVPPRGVIVVGGPGKSGKTSLAKAALIPALAAEEHRTVYLRCRADIERSLPREIAPLLAEYAAPAEPAGDIPGTLQQLVEASAPKRVAVFLDQFDRVTTSSQFGTKAGRESFTRFLADQLLKYRDPRLTLVLLVTDEGPLAGQLFELCRDHDVATGLVQCLAFGKEEIAGILRTLAGKAGLTLDPRIIDELAARYEQTRTAAPEKRFTLAHVQAICHLLISTNLPGYESYKKIDRNVEALHQAINVSDIISFVEDFGWSDAVQLRNLIKVPLLSSTNDIAEFVKKHFEELLSREQVLRRRGQGGT